METWYFSFQLRHPFKDYLQPIEAESYSAARKTMFEIYGAYWGFSHSEKEYKESDILSSSKLLPVVRVDV